MEGKRLKSVFEYLLNMYPWEECKIFFIVNVLKVTILI